MCWLPEWTLDPIDSGIPNDSHFAANCRYGVLFYVVVKLLTSIATFILNQFELYCDGTFSVYCGFPYIALIVNGAQLWAMYCLVCFYHNYHKELSPYRPFPKFLSIKLVVFFAFWQSIIIAGAVSDKLIAAPAESLYTTQDVSTGLQDLIICVEMFIAAWFHIYAFSYQDYKRRDAEKLTFCGMVVTVFDVKDVAGDLKHHAKVHAKAVKRLAVINKNEETEMTADGAFPSQVDTSTSDDILISTPVVQGASP